MDITSIVNAPIALVAAVVTVFVIARIQVKTAAAQREEISAWVEIAVTAAEHIYTGQGRSKKKRTYVFQFLVK